MKLRVRYVAAAILVLFCAQEAQADPITIVSGALTYPAPPGGLTLVGNSRGFTADVGYVPIEGFYPGSDCIVCPPGQQISLSAGFLGGAFAGGTVTLDGASFSPGLIDDEIDRVSLNTQFQAGTIVLPALPGDGAPLTITAPFTFRGLVFTAPLGPGEIVDLVGRGGLTIIFHPMPADNGWRTTSFRYEFHDASAVPEPGTWLLVGSGVWLASLARRRKTRGHYAGAASRERSRSR